MKREIEHLCECLWWAIGQRGPATAAEPDWSRWLALVDEHKLGAFLYSRLRGRAEWPEQVRSALAAQHVTSGFLNGLRLREQARILARILPAARCVVLKGAALALTRYAEAAERDMVDLDLFCARREDVDTALDILRANQYAPTRAIPGHHHLPPMLHRSGRLSVELHTNLTTPGLPSAFLEQFFADRVHVSTPGGIAVPVADRAHLLFHHGLHTLKDPIESPLLRNLFEIAWMASDFGPDEWTRFTRIAESSGRSEVVRRALALARDYFPVDLPPFKRPRYSSIEFWARRRLGWIEDAMRPATRRLRHIGVKHFDRMPSGRWRTDALDMARVAAVSVKNGIAHHARARLAPLRGALLHRVEAHELAFGEHAALLRPESGQVFVLRGDAIAVWRAAAAPVSGAELYRRLLAQGLPPRAARRAVRSLLALELIAPASNTAGAHGAPDL